MQDEERPSPPQLARFLFSWLLRGDGEETVLGDVEEGFDERAREQGVAYARRWYRRQALASVWALWMARLRRHEAAPRAAAHARREGWISVLLQDIRYSARGLRRSTGFTVVAVLTLALGIGATTAIFSVVNGVLLQPLAYDDPDELVVVYTDLPKIGWFKTWISGPELLDLRTRTDIFEAVAISNGSGSLTMTGQGEAEQVEAHRISWEMLPLLGVEAHRGRRFTREEDLPEGPAAVMLSYEFWQRRFGGDRDLVGARVVVDGVSREVVGILPRGFSLELPPDTMEKSKADLWLPAQVDYQGWDRHSHGMTPIARLAPGVSVAEASAAMAAFGQQLEEEYYEQTGFALHVFGLQPDLVDKARPALLALLGAVAFVLLIACANVANLLLARAASRERELGVRKALGAHRGRLLAQALTESGLLGLLGGAGGLLLALLGVRLLLAMSPAEVPRLAAVRIDGTTLGFTAGATLLTVLVFGLVPALRVSASRRLEEILRPGGRSPVSARLGGRLRGGMVIAQIALSLMLLVGAGLMTKSFIGLARVEPGFDPSHRLTFGVSLPVTAYEPSVVPGFYARLEERLLGLPGVEAVGSISHLPLGGTSWSGTQTFYDTTNGAPGNQEYFETDLRVVTPGYFDAMGVRLLAGRLFDSRDTADGTPVAVIDDNLAQRVWPGVEAVGKKFGIGADPESGRRVEIIGVVDHVRHHRLDADGREQIYFPHARVAFSDLRVVARTTVDPRQLAGAVRRELQALDPNLPAYDLEPMEEYVESALAPTRFNLVLLGIFSLLGFSLAAIGIYGVVAYAVSLSLQELGIRKALGAQNRHLLLQVLGLGAKLSVAGVVVGLVGAYALTRFMTSLLFDVAATDAATFAGMTGLLVVVSLVASYVPGRRASRVDAAVTLRGG